MLMAAAEQLVQNYGSSDNLLCDHGVVQINRIGPGAITNSMSHCTQTACRQSAKHCADKILHFLTEGVG